MANNVFQVKRTNVSGRTPNTTGSYGTNSQYIAAGEFALNMADGILYTSNGSAVITVGSNLVNQNITGNLTVKAIIANGSIGTAGQVLTTNSTGVYWSTAGGGSGTVTSVATGNGMTGGPITTTGTVSVLANTGIVANSTGTFVNATYIGTLTANNTSFVGTVSAANVVSNAQLSGNLANYQTTAGLSANVATLTSNNSTFSYGKTEGALNVNSALTANNSTNLGGVAASGYQTTAGLAGNVATLTANNATNLNGQAASFYTNASNISTGTLPDARLSSAVVNTSGAFTRTGVTTFSANVILGSSGLSANGGFGTAGQTLHSNGTATYWAADDQGVTSVATGNGLVGGTITTTGTVSILANTGIVANSTGTFVNATYIGTISANNASFLGGTAAASYQLNSTLSANVATLTSNNSTFSYGKTEGNLNVNSALYANASISNTFTVGTGNYFVSNGNFGIGTNLPATKLTVNPKVSDDNSIAYDSNTVYFTHQTRTSTTTLNDPKPVLLLARQGTGGQAYGAAAEFNLSRYENSGVNSRTRLDIRLAHGNFLTNNTNVLTLLSNGNVGIGNTAPNAKLQVTGTANISGAVVIAGITTFSANIILGTSGLSSNGGFGTAGQVLTTNGTATYWAAAAGGGYYKGGSAAVGTLAVGGQNLFRVNANTLNFNTTIAAGENAQATGPIAVAAGITLTVASGARVSIV